MKSAWTDAVVNILRAGVHVQGNAELVGQITRSSKNDNCSFESRNLRKICSGSRTTYREKCRDRCGCVMGIEGWSSGEKKCMEGKHPF